MQNLVFQTDFGTDNLSVSSMIGVSMKVNPDLRIWNATHAVRQFDVLAACDALMYNLPYWPAGTVFVSVVDPGVGTARRSCAAKLKGGIYIVTPDNGTLTYIKRDWGIEQVREIDEKVNRYPGSENIHIFHGRDVYAYCGARLAAGVIDFAGVGPEYPVDEVVEAPFIEPGHGDGAVWGMVNEATEHFGLVSSNIPFEWLAAEGMQYGDRVAVLIENGGKTVCSKTLPLEKSFGYVALGAEFVFSSETRTVMLGTNQGNFTADNHIGFNGEWKLTVKKA